MGWVVDAFRIGCRQGRRTTLPESRFMQSFCVPCLSGLWGTELRLKKGLTIGRCLRLTQRTCSIGEIQGQLCLAHNCNSPITLMRSYGFHLAEDSWGWNGSHQWVADLRPHKCWMLHVYWMSYNYLEPNVPYACLVSHKYLMSLGLPSLPMFSTHMPTYFICYHVYIHNWLTYMYLTQLMIFACVSQVIGFCTLLHLFFLFVLLIFSSRIESLK